MHKLIFVAVIICILSGGAHAELYKCTESGKTTYSDRPCPGATKLEIKRHPIDQTAASARLERDRAYLAEQSRRDEVERINGRIGALQTEKNLLLEQLDRELAALRGRKNLARNNLAGATWQQSLSAEMQAVTDRYRARIDAVDNDIASLRDALAQR